MGPWARQLLDRYQVPDQVPGTGVVVSHLQVEPALVTARVDDRRATVSAPPIGAGIWAAIDAQVDPGRQSEELAQLLEHTWDEPLLPEEIVRIGLDDDVDALLAALASEIERDPVTLLRWRGYGDATPTGDEAWRGGELPPLPPPARRPPDSVPKRFGASGITVAGEDVVETLMRAYRAFAD